MGQFSVEKPVLPGSVLSGNQHTHGRSARNTSAEGDLMIIAMLVACLNQPHSQSRRTGCASLAFSR